MTIFEVVHIHDTRMGSVPVEDVVAVFENFNDANDFMERFRNPHVFDEGCGLECGLLRINERRVITHGEFDLKSFDPRDMWWMGSAEIEAKIDELAWDLHAAYRVPTDEYGRVTEEISHIGYEIYPVGTSEESIIGDIRSTAEKAGIPFCTVVERARRYC